VLATVTLNCGNFQFSTCLLLATPTYKHKLTKTLKLEGMQVWTFIHFKIYC